MTPLIQCHTSKINDLHSSLNSEKTLQNFLYLYEKKTHMVFYFFIFHFVTSIYKTKIKVAQNEKKKKTMWVS